MNAYPRDHESAAKLIDRFCSVYGETRVVPLNEGKNALWMLVYLALYMVGTVKKIIV